MNPEQFNQINEKLDAIISILRGDSSNIKLKAQENMQSFLQGKKNNPAMEAFLSSKQSIENKNDEITTSNPKHYQYPDILTPTEGVDEV